MLNRLLNSTAGAVQAGKAAALALFEANWIAIENKLVPLLIDVASSHLDDSAHMTAAFESAHALLPLPLRIGIRQALFVEFCEARKATVAQKVRAYSQSRVSLQGPVGVSGTTNACSAETPEIPAEYIANYSPDTFEFYKLQLLVNLAKMDGGISTDELEFIENEMARSSLTTEQRNLIAAQLGCASASPAMVGLDTLAKVPEQAVALLLALTTLAKHDANVHVAEKMYIRKIGERLGFSLGDIDEFVASS